jgi:hypothetical protein
VDALAHSFGQWVLTEEATILACGIRTRSCSVCSGEETEEIAKTTEHTWDEGVVTTPPTKKEAGEKTFTCECGETKTEEIPATKKANGGCGAVILATSLSLVTLAGAGVGTYLVLRKRKEN